MITIKVNYYGGKEEICFVVRRFVYEVLFNHTDVFLRHLQMRELACQCIMYGAHIKSAAFQL
jgi:hypothetical protein